MQAPNVDLGNDSIKDRYGMGAQSYAQWKEHVIEWDWVIAVKMATVAIDTDIVLTKV